MLIYPRWWIEVRQYFICQPRRLICKEWDFVILFAQLCRAIEFQEGPTIRIYPCHPSASSTRFQDGRPRIRPPCQANTLQENRDYFCCYSKSNSRRYSRLLFRFTINGKSAKRYPAGSNRYQPFMQNNQNWAGGKSGLEG